MTSLRIARAGGAAAELGPGKPAAAAGSDSEAGASSGPGRPPAPAVGGRMPKTAPVRVNAARLAGRGATVPDADAGEAAPEAPTGAPAGAPALPPLSARGAGEGARALAGTRAVPMLHAFRA
jgi:hypothetical protein